MKLENKTGHIQIPLSQLRITSNVRTDFDESEIAELAQSIKENGLINAITVKPPVTDEHGDKTYEVIAGGRRIRAHQWLCDNGFDASMIDCKIVTGDMWTLQMIENIQRTDLTPRDKENAIAAALEQGLTQKQIADRLSKPIQYVNDIVAGAKVRKLADAAYLNTDGVSTKALAQLRGIPESELTEYLEELCMRGGSVATATALLHEWKAKQAEKELAKETPHGDFTPPAPTTPGSSDESEIDVDAYINGMFKDEADDIEFDDAPNGLKIGDEVRGLGKRLYFSDLAEGMYFIVNQSTESLKVYKLCKIISIDDNDEIEYDDGDNPPSLGYSGTSRRDIENDAEPHEWIYAVSPETHKVDEHTLEHNDEWDNESKNFIAPTELTEAEFNCCNERNKKGLKNPVSRQIQVRWATFCRSKKIPEDKKSAFAFYQALLDYFENTFSSDDTE